MIDLHEILSLPADAEIQAFNAEQAWSLKIYLCVAFRSSANASQLIVTKPFLPEALISRQVLAKLSGNKQVGTVQKIHMVSN